ncbi:alpha/beta hydrolase [uncultured Dysosmobacter sp.]|uniref:alpha/beta hydrolase n=1 Tax=uncultured Dysosmobacter sp. TaxID=2591384 RepID=UPI0026210AA1|nr:alpha/beta hydrolase [uncultured Dysosmobacter sp.]
MKNSLISILLTLALILTLAACGSTGTTENPGTGGVNEETSDSKNPSGGTTDSEDPSSNTEITSVAGTYTFEEAAMGGQFTVPWKLELRDDGTYTITEENPFMGTNTYEGTYTVEDGVVITGPFEGAAPVATFFESDKSCKWTLDGDKCVPVNYDPNATPDLGGLPGLPGGNEGGGQDTKAETVAYASNSSAQVCDIYTPEGTDKAPVIVLVHGGGFMFGDQGMDIIKPVIEAAVAHGYAVVSVDYRKSSEAVFPAALSDVKAAVRFVRANAEKYGFDENKIVIWGESAGAYLSLMTALTPGVTSLDGDVTDNAGVSSEVRALVSFYAPVEFYTLYEEAGKPEAAADSFESKFLGQDISADADATYATYWETYADGIPENMCAWVQAGDADQRVPCTQSENFAKRLAEKIGEENVEFGLIPGADHEDDAFYTQENLNAVLTWLDGVLA